jgi:hypothetical protein
VGDVLPAEEDITRPRAILKEVVFPAPLGPRRPTTSPGSREKETPSTTRRRL